MTGRPLPKARTRKPAPKNDPTAQSGGAGHGFEGVPPAVLAAWRLAQQRTPQREPGPDFLGTRQLAAAWGVTQPVAARRVRQLQAAGRIEASLRDIIDAGGRCYPIPVYRLLSAAAA